MNIDLILRAFFERPTYQRLFMAFTVGLFLSCSARVSEAQPGRMRPSASLGGASGAGAAAAVSATLR